MKLKKMSVYVMVIAIGLCLSMLPVTASAASYKCQQCSIVRLGMVPGAFETTNGFMVQVDDLSDNGWSSIRTFYLNDDLGKAGWATVLTAYSMGKTLWLQLADTVAGSLITKVHIND